MLLRYGVRFDRDTSGALSLGLEAAHARRRIVHATGDGTGRAIMRALSDAVRATPSITVLEGPEAAIRRSLRHQTRGCYHWEPWREPPRLPGPLTRRSCRFRHHSDRAR